MKCLLLSVVTLLSSQFYAQSNNLNEQAFEKMSVKEGLPSSEVFHVVEDQLGYLWFATDNGLSKYNGVRHFIYDQKSGLKNTSIIRLFLQKDTSIVGIDLNDELFKLKNGRVTYLIPNDTLKKYTIRLGSPMSFYEDEKGNYHIGYRKGYLVFSSKGERLSVDLPSQEYHINSFKTYENQYFSYFFCPDPRFLDNQEFFLFSNQKRIEVSTKESIIMSSSIYTSGEDSIKVFYVDRTLFLVKNHSLFYQTEFDNDIITSTVKGNEIFIGTKDGGLFHYGINEDNVILKNHLFQRLSISSILISSEGNIWCTTLEDGIRVKYFSNSIQIFESKIHEKITCLYHGSSILKVGFENGDIRIFPDNKTINVKSKVYSFKDFKGRQIASVTGRPIVFDSPSSSNYKRFRINEEVDGFKGFWFINDSTILFHTHSHGFSEWIMGKEFYKSRVTFPRKVITMVTYDRGVYVSCEGLVQILEDKNYAIVHSIEQKEPVFYFFIRDKGLSGVTANNLINIHGNSIDTVYNFPTESVISAYFKNGLLHTSTSKGLYSWSLKERTPKLIGYESIPDIQSIQVDLDTLYFASKKSVYKKSIADLNCSAPDISTPYIIVNGEKYSSELTPILPYGDLDIQVPIEAILRKKGEIEYRYKLAGRSRFTYTTDPTINLSSLPYGEFRLEISATINGVVFSPTQYIQFTIDKPYWLKWPFILFLCLTILIVSGFIVRLRIARLKRKHQLQATMTQLKSEALSSQLNPHLLFNIMNSIQGLVAEVDVEKANIYIARFSTFLRNCLEYSSVQKVRIDQEIRMLKEYIAVEKIRFGDKVKFDLQVSLPGSNNEVMVPPLFLQPILENSIKHGLMPSRIKERCVIIKVYLIQEGIMIKVEDNGVGFKEDYSFGTGLNNSRDRIKLLNPKNELYIEQLNSPTIVTVKIFK